MSARDDILAAVRKAKPQGVALPDVRAAANAFNVGIDLVSEFTASAQIAGAKVIRTTHASLESELLAAFPMNGRRLAARNGDNGTGTPHSFADVDTFVCEGSLGVAENGTIWVPLSAVRHRAALFLATNVIIVLEESKLVRDMHAAYDAVDVGSEAFGVFVGGPSKTADIEQQLVVGAHGPKELTIALVES